jgi:hypothetical protein
MKITVNDRQTIWDIAVQCCGSADAAFAIARLNSISLSDNLAPGLELQVPGEYNKRNVDYYKRNKIEPATGLQPAQNEMDGIGYWIIEDDFVST